MSNNITVTGKTGPGITETSKVYSDVNWFKVDYTVNVITINYGLVNAKTAEVDLYGIATFTYTISSHSATVAVS